MQSYQGTNYVERELSKHFKKTNLGHSHVCVCLSMYWIVTSSSTPKICHHFEAVTSVHFEIAATATHVRFKCLWLVLVAKSQAPLTLLCFVAYTHNGRRKDYFDLELGGNEEVIFPQPSSQMPEFYPQSPWGSMDSGLELLA